MSLPFILPTPTTTTTSNSVWIGTSGLAPSRVRKEGLGRCKWGRADGCRAKYKKFGTRSEAEAYVGKSTPYTSSSSGQASSSTSKPTSKQQISKAPSTSKAGPNFKPIVSDSHTPLTLANRSSLPPDLAEIADEGFSFTTPPHRLIVYTDGSSLGNGKMGARAGLGVYWGNRGRAGEGNIAERVPGNLQTNNRGELLVRPPILLLSTSFFSSKALCHAR